MKTWIAYALAAQLMISPLARAASPSVLSAGDAQVYATQVQRYQVAKAAYVKSGAEAFASQFKFLSAADRKFLITQLAGKRALPELRSTGATLELVFAQTAIAFEVASILEGQITIDGSKFRANFGGSLELLTDDLQKILQRKYPSQFARHTSPWQRWSRVLVPEAHAVSDKVLIWGAIAAVVAGVVLKGVIDGKQATTKVAEASKPVYYTEPAAPHRYVPPPLYLPSDKVGAAGAGGGHAPSTGYSGIVGPRVNQSAPPPQVFMAPPASDLPPLAEPEPDLSGKPPGVTQAAPPVEAAPVVAADAYKPYEKALCGPAPAADSICTIMHSLLTDMQGADKEKFKASEASQAFPVSRQQFFRRVLTKLKEVSADANKKDVADAYVAFVNANFGLKLTLDEARKLDVEKQFNELDKRAMDIMSVIVNSAAPNIEIGFGASAIPSFIYEPTKGELSWVPRLDAQKTVVCKQDAPPVKPALPAKPADKAATTPALAGSPAGNGSQLPPPPPDAKKP